MKEKFKSVGDWFKGRESQKERIAKEITNIVAARVDKIVDHSLNKLDFGFDILCEKDNLETEVYNLKLKLKDKDNCIESLKTELKATNEENEKLYKYLEKLTKVIKKTDDSLVKEIRELKSERYKVVKVKETKATTQKIGIKSGASTSKIIKKVKEGK